MVFTPTSGGVPTVGLARCGHQWRDRDGNADDHRQSLLVTHWAYMLPYDPANLYNRRRRSPFRQIRCASGMDCRHALADRQPRRYSAAALPAAS